MNSRPKAAPDTRQRRADELALARLQVLLGTQPVWVTVVRLDVLVQILREAGREVRDAETTGTGADG